MPTERLILAVDGGGTSTTACLATATDGQEEANVIGHGAAGQSNPAVVGFDRCHDAVLAAADQAVRSASLDTSRALDQIVVGLAGIEATNLHRDLEKAIARVWQAASIDIVTDIELLLLAASGKRPVVSLISGTGSVAVGRDLTGTTVRAGGRGYLTGDDGSGFWIGRQGFVAALRCLDNLGPATSLVGAIAERIGSYDPAAWTNSVYSGDQDSRTVLAQCAPLVFEHSGAGDAVAQSILKQASLELAALVEAVRKQLATSPDTYDLVLAGGVLVHQPTIRATLVEHLAERKLAPADQIVVKNPATAAAVRLASDA